MNNLKRIIVILGALACFAACTGDVLFTFLLGSRYPGYSQVTDVMSLLGASDSPVSEVISAWWIILGVLIIVFAIGFRVAFYSPGFFLRTSFWLLVIYGVGEGFGSALFKANMAANSMTTSYIIHDIFGGAGVFAILIVPLTVERIIPFSLNSIFKGFSRFVVIAGVLLLILFSFRFAGSESTFPVKYTGLWQRLFMFDYYIYILVIAFIMMKQALFPETDSMV
ncbi:MAG: DUF998 domain-containing protein [Bacteroidales bacterium]